MKSFLKPNSSVFSFCKSVVLACWVIVLLSCCNKPATQAPVVATPVTTTNHTIKLTWITNYPTVKIHYTYPSSNQSTLISQEDTISNTYSVTYQYPEGIPNKYPHYLDGNCLNTTSDSIEVQIWIDGVLKASAKDMNYVDLNYMY